MSDEEH